MAYGLKYQSTFDPVGPVAGSPVYTIYILEKNYVGGVTDVTCSTTPVLHQWQIDDPKAAIKGSSLSLSLINENGNLPLESFFSTDDDQFLVALTWGIGARFVGYLVQDDCSETMVDFTHEINLSANDNLGLLKNVPLDKAAIVYETLGSINDNWSTTAPHTVTIPASLAPFIQVGDILQIHGLIIIFDLTYHITDISASPDFLVSETVATGTTGQNDDITLLRPILFADKIPLLTVVKNCLAATNLEIITNIFCNYYTIAGTRIEVTSFGANASTSIIQILIPRTDFVAGQTFTVSGSVSNDGTYTIVSIDPASFYARFTVLEAVIDENNTQNVTITWDKVLWWLNTLVDPQTFLKDSSVYDDCYTILTKVLERFNCVLFQAKGAWNIVHWDELRYSGYAIPGFSYDATFTLIGPVTLDGGFNKIQAGIGENTVAETGLLHKISRPFKFDKETFNFKQPARLLRNYDLQELGDLLNTTTTGSGVTLQTTREYGATWWYYTDAFPTASGVNGAAEFFIRVISDYLDNEIERYLVTKNNGIHSYKIEANAGDTFTFSFSFKTPDFNWDTGTIVWIIQLADGTNTRYAMEPGNAGEVEPGWGTGVGFNVVISGDSQNGFTSVSITSNRVPFDGLLTFYLLDEASAAANETQYKDIRLEYNYYINESTKIIGQTHKTEQIAVIKQNEDEEIFLDDSPRNSIAGALFLDSLTGLLQDRTKTWYLANPADTRKLGDLTTFEMLFWRRIVRSVLEGTFNGLISVDNDHISMVSVFNYTFFSGLNFVAGTMEIDYRNNKFSGTLWEICTDTEVDGDLTSTYEFKYLYQTK